MAESGKLILDSNGFAEIKLGKRIAKVKPESVPVWAKRGWKAIVETAPTQNEGSSTDTPAN